MDFARLGGASARGGRRGLFPSFGKLYPGGSDLLATVEDEDAVRRVLSRACPEYAVLWGAWAERGRGVGGAGQGGARCSVPRSAVRYGGGAGVARVGAAKAEGGVPSRAHPPTAPPDSAPSDARGLKDISDTFFRASVRALEGAFEGQAHYACFYAYAKLKEQEVKNIAWVATCMEHGVYSEMERIVPVFSKVAATTRAR